MQDQIFSVLDRWTNLRVESLGHFWLIAGTDPFGVSRCGSRQDGLSLAADLRDIALREGVQLISEPEPSNPAPQDEAPSTGDVYPPAAATVEGAYPGLFLQRDDEARLRSDLYAAITEIEERRLEASGDINKAADALQAIADYHNANSQTLTDEIKRRYNEGLEYRDREALIRAHAAKLRSAARRHDLPMLQAMIETHQEGWP